MRPPTADHIADLIVVAMQRNDWQTVSNLQPQLDRLDVHKPGPDTLTAALWYASIGLRVFPLQPRLKIPYKGTRGCNDATNDPDLIRTWWQRWPDSNLAIATGHLVDVVDIDGPAGVKSWAHFADLPHTLGTVSTPRPGGAHLYITATGDGNSAGIFPGIDIRGTGGYVVAPPSTNADGKTYTWRRPLQLPAQQVVAA